MNDEKKLLKLQREMRDLEKQEMKLSGSLDTLCKGLSKSLGNENIKDDKITKAVQDRIKELKKKHKKAKMLFSEKMEQIEEMSELLGD